MFVAQARIHHWTRPRRLPRISRNSQVGIFVILKFHSLLSYYIFVGRRIPVNADYIQAWYVDFPIWCAKYAFLYG